MKSERRGIQKKIIIFFLTNTNKMMQKERERERNKKKRVIGFEGAIIIIYIIFNDDFKR